MVCYTWSILIKKSGTTDPLPGLFAQKKVKPTKVKLSWAVGSGYVVSLLFGQLAVGRMESVEGFAKCRTGTADIHAHKAGALLAEG